MAAVDPKPTYSPTVIYRLASWVFASNRYQHNLWFDEVFGVGEGSARYRDLRDVYNRANTVGGELPDEYWTDEVDPGSVASMYAVYEVDEHRMPDADRAGDVVETMMSFMKGATRVHMDSRASFALWADVLGRAHGSSRVIPDDWQTALRHGVEIASAGCAPMKMKHESVLTMCNSMRHSVLANIGDYAQQRAVAYRTVFHSASHGARAAYVALSRHRRGRLLQKLVSQAGGIKKVASRLVGTLTYDIAPALAIDYLYLGSVRLFRHRDTVYACTMDQAEKAYHIAHRAMMAVMYASLEEPFMAGSACIPVYLMKQIITLMRNSISDICTSGMALSSLAKAMHTLWYVEFHQAYEDTLPSEWDTGANERAEALQAEAYSMCPGAEAIHTLVKTLTPLLRLEALRLHHCVVSPDTPIDMLIERGFTSETRIHDPDPAAWNEFMRFSRTYELCAYLTKKRAWPEVQGDDECRMDDAYKSCLRGHFKLPERQDHGKLSISGHFPYVLYADSHALSAKDATRVPWDEMDLDRVDSKYSEWEHNELLHALKKGNNLGAPLNWSIADSRTAFTQSSYDKPILVTTAAKAENTKCDLKARITFSAVGEFRRPQAEFDHNCQAINDIIGCGSIRADPVKHERGMARVALGTSRHDFTSSHDISDWSGAQQREAFREFLEYRASMFKGISPKAVSAAWVSFSVHMKKNGVHRSTICTQGGFQGFPGTIDTGLHVLILVSFLYKCAQRGYIDPKKPTLAKATIDDCLAQFASVRIPRKALAAELTEHYRSLGYEIDSIKSVLSHAKALYLNQGFINGGRVSQGLKVFLKIDRAMEDLLKSPFDDVSSCMSGAKAALDNGGKDIAMFYGGIVVSLFNLYPAAPDLRKLDNDSMTMAWYLPRGDGGFGMPSMCDIMTKEHPDARCMANYVIRCWVASRVDASLRISPRAMSIYNKAKMRPWAIVSATSVFFNVEKATRLGVVQIESIRRNILRSKMTEFGLAEPYQSLLASAENPMLSAVYSALMLGEGEPVDAVFCSVFSSHLPESFLDAALGKAMSSRAARSLLGPREVVHAQRSIKHAFKRLVADLISTKDIPVISEIDISEGSAYLTTVSERECFHAVNGLKLVNHTIPSAFEVAVVTSQVASPHEGASMGFDFSTLQSISEDTERSSRSTISKHGYFSPWKAKNWVADSHDVYSSLNSVTHKFLMGCAVLRWAELQGKDITSWARVYGARWLGTSELMLDEYVHISVQGHLKRSPAAYGDRFHPVFGNRNILRSCMINEKAISVLLEDSTYLIDPLSILAAMYATAGLTASFLLDVYNKYGIEETNFSWGAGADPRCLANYVDVSFTPPSGNDTIEELLDLLEDSVGFIHNDGGLADELKRLSEPGAFDEYFLRMKFDGDPDSSEVLADLAPTLGSDVRVSEAPPIAVLLGARDRANVLITDTFERGKRVRLLEVSGSSVRHLGKYILYNTYKEIGRSRIVAAHIGDEDALSDIVKNTDWRACALSALGVVRETFGQGNCMARTAEALRYAGLVHCRHDDDEAPDDLGFAALMERHIKRDRDVVLSALLAAAQSESPVREWDYTAPITHARFSRDPEKANQAERRVQFSRRKKHIASMYGARIKAIQGGTPKKGLDSEMSEDPYSQGMRVAYLAGIKNGFQSLEVSEDVVVDFLNSAHNLMNSCMEKIRAQTKVEVDMPYYDAHDIYSVETVANLVEDYCYRHPRPSKGWHPDEFSRGVKKALEWAEKDLKLELRRQYFVPTGVHVTARVRKHNKMPEVGKPPLYVPPHAREPDDTGPQGSPSIIAGESQHSPEVAIEPAGETMKQRMMRAMREAAAQRSLETSLERAQLFFSDKTLIECIKYLRDQECQAPEGCSLSAKLLYGLYPRAKQAEGVTQEDLDLMRAACLSVQQKCKGELKIPADWAAESEVGEHLVE